MDTVFWHERWQTGQIGFHADVTHPLLTRYWPGITGGHGARVWVPLCGKSLDLLFLARQGCRVTGIELSPIAIRQFLAENDLHADKSESGGMPIYSASGIRLIEGDFFELTQQTLGPVDVVYDRAALIAMPPGLQQRYARQLLALTPVAAPILLITLDYDPGEMNGPPFATPADQVMRLFGARYHIEILECVDALAGNPALRDRGLSALTETAWHLRPR